MENDVPAKILLEGGGLFSQKPANKQRKILLFFPPPPLLQSEVKMVCKCGEQIRNSII